MSTYPSQFIAERRHLQLHPKNMRRVYRQANLNEMAASLSAYAAKHETGNQHALLVVPVGKPPTFRQDTRTKQWYAVEGVFSVVDGNVRYLSGEVLKEQCPPYKCEIISESEAEQMLTMTISTIRFEVDPISEALHYKRLKEEFNLSDQKVAKATGKNLATVSNRLLLLQLDEEIQDLIVQEQLSSDPRVARALLSIEDPKVRLQFAKRAAGEGMTIVGILAAVEHLQTALRAQTRKRKRQASPEPMIGHAAGMAGRTVKDESANVPWQQLREAARGMCSVCDVKADSLKDVPEPAFALLTHQANDVCGKCPVRRIEGACKDCPGVELLKNVIQFMERPKPMGAHAHAA